MDILTKKGSETLSLLARNSTPSRRSSFPPISIPSYGCLGVNSDFLRDDCDLFKESLPVIDSQCRSRPPSRQSESMFSLKSANASPAANKHFCVIESGYEEAGASGCCENTVPELSVKKKDCIEHFNLKRPCSVRLMNGCEDRRRLNLEIDKPQPNNETQLSKLCKLLSDDNNLLKMTGNKAQYMPRRVVIQTSVSKPMTVKRNKAQPNHKNNR